MTIMVSSLNKTTSNLRKINSQQSLCGHEAWKAKCSISKTRKGENTQKQVQKSSSEKQHYSPLYFAGLCVPFHDVFVIWTAIQAVLMPSHTVYSTVVTTILQKITESQLTGVVLMTESSPYLQCEQGALSRTKFQSLAPWRVCVILKNIHGSNRN